LGVLWLLYTLTIRNIADLAGNVMNDSTFNFTYGINPQYHVATIAELRAKWTTALDPNANTSDNTIYKLTGDAVVTAINSSYRNQIFIQDATAAIVIDNTADNTTNGPAILTNIVQGDKINSIYGSLTNYYGHLQLVVKQPSYTKIAEYAEVNPIVVTLAQLNDNNYMNSIQSQLIKINSVRFENPPATSFANNTYYKLRQGEVIQDSAVWTHIFNVLVGTIPTTNKDITGVNKITRNTYCIIPRKDTDIKEPVSIASVGDFNAAIYPNPVQDLLTVQANNQIKNIEIFNMFGQRIHIQQGNSNVHHLNVSDLSSGVYMLKLTSSNGFTTSKFVKR
jgi:hypothetical protein